MLIKVRPNKKNRCGSGYPTVPIFLTPTLNIFSPNFEAEKQYHKRMYQNAHLNEKLSFYAFILQYSK